nr:MAG TPA: hypothetical protein [Caudoviricetes sp.]
MSLFLGIGSCLSSWIGLTLTCYSTPMGNHGYRVSSVLQ